MIELLLDWRIIALLSIVSILYFRVMAKNWYQWLWEKLRFRIWLIAPAAALLVLLILREVYLYPVAWIAVDFGSLSPFAQLLLYGDTIHFRSILFFGILILALWRKYDKLLPALAVGWFCIGFVELTFILQHYAAVPGRFMGWGWYLPFIGIMAYFLVLHKSFRIAGRWFWIFLISAFICQYALLPFFPYWFWHIEVTAPFTPGIRVDNPGILSDPPIGTWVFWFLNHFMKTLFALAFYQINLVKNDGVKN